MQPYEVEFFNFLNFQQLFDPKFGIFMINLVHYFVSQKAFLFRQNGEFCSKDMKFVFKNHKFGVEIRGILEKMLKIVTS